MAKVKNFEKVLKVLQDVSPEVVTKEALEAILGTDIVQNRISTYIWEIKNKTGVPIESIKEGRRVIGFRIAVAEEAHEPLTEQDEVVEYPAQAAPIEDEEAAEAALANG